MTNCEEYRRNSLQTETAIKISTLDFPLITVIEIKLSLISLCTLRGTKISHVKVLPKRFNFNNHTIGYFSYKFWLSSGFLFAIANVASITAMIFFHMIDLFHPRGQQLCKFLGTKEGFYIRKEFNPHMIEFILVWRRTNGNSLRFSGINL